MMEEEKFIISHHPVLSFSLHTVHYKFSKLIDPLETLSGDVFSRANRATPSIRDSNLNTWNEWRYKNRFRLSITGANQHKMLILILHDTRGVRSTSVTSDAISSTGWADRHSYRIRTAYPSSVSFLSSEQWSRIKHHSSSRIDVAKVGKWIIIIEASQFTKGS